MKKMTLIVGCGPFYQLLVLKKTLRHTSVKSLNRTFIK